MLLQTASELTFRRLAYTVLVRITSSAIELRLDAHRSPPPALYHKSYSQATFGTTGPFVSKVPGPSNTGVTPSS